MEIKRVNLDELQVIEESTENVAAGGICGLACGGFFCGLGCPAGVFCI
jgi:hypothetical protein